MLNPTTARTPTEVIGDALNRMINEKPVSERPLLSEWVIVVERHIAEAGWVLVRKKE